MERKRFYLTKDGYKKTKEKYQKLRKIRQAKAKNGIPRFFQSEEVNPEYLVLQEDLELLEEQIAEFKDILRNAKLIKAPPRRKQNIIHLGASVLVENGNGNQDEFHIVGSLEANPSTGEISDESPVGQALLGHKEGEEVSIDSATKTIYKIKRIQYKL